MKMKPACAMLLQLSVQLSKFRVSEGSSSMLRSGLRAKTEKLAPCKKETAAKAVRTEP